MLNKIESFCTVRLYCLILEEGGAINLTVREILDRTGLASRKSLAIARTELKDLGMIDCLQFGHRYRIRLLAASHKPISSAVIVAVDPLPPPVEDEVEQSLVERCEAIDALPADGTEQDKNSNFQKKRKKQVDVVRDIFTEYFPGTTIAKDSALDCLRIQPCTREILAACEVATSQGKQINSPLAYIKKTLEGRKSRGETFTPEVVEDFTPRQKEFIAQRKAGTLVVGIPPWAKFDPTSPYYEGESDGN